MANTLRTTRKPSNTVPDKLSKYKASLSLAEKLDLVDKPPGPLSISEWEAVKSKASIETCPICLEKFKLRKQVILNCGHCYHESCFKSYSRHLHLAFLQLRCALCRAHVFDFTYCDRGAILYMHDSAIMIQSLFRGSHVRSSITPIPGSYMSRRRILVRMKLISSRVTRKQQDKENALTPFLERIKKTSEAALRETRVSLRLLDQIRQGRQIMKINQSEWTAILIAAVERDETECAICLERFSKSQISLLSCSHCFHSACIAACEKFGACVCPVCRHEYSSISLNANSL